MSMFQTCRGKSGSQLSTCNWAVSGSRVNDVKADSQHGLGLVMPTLTIVLAMVWIVTRDSWVDY